MHTNRKIIWKPNQSEKLESSFSSPFFPFRLDYFSYSDSLRSFYFQKWEMFRASGWLSFPSFFSKLVIAWIDLHESTSKRNLVIPAERPFGNRNGLLSSMPTPTSKREAPPALLAFFPIALLQSSIKGKKSPLGKETIRIEELLSLRRACWQLKWGFSFHLLFLFSRVSSGSE